MELLQVLVLSTGHVTEADMQRLAGPAGDEPDALFAACDAVGAWVYAPTEDTLPDVRTAGYSQSLVKALGFARRLGASHIRLDRDGPVLDHPELDRHAW